MPRSSPPKALRSPTSRRRRAIAEAVVGYGDETGSTPLRHDGKSRLGSADARKGPGRKCRHFAEGEPIARCRRRSRHDLEFRPRIPRWFALRAFLARLVRGRAGAQAGLAKLRRRRVRAEAGADAARVWHAQGDVLFHDLRHAAGLVGGAVHQRISAPSRQGTDQTDDRVDGQPAERRAGILGGTRHWARGFGNRAGSVDGIGHAAAYGSCWERMSGNCCRMG